MKRHHTDPALWRSLAQVPVAVFHLIAQANGDISSAERRTFLQEWVVRPERFAISRDPVLREIFAWALEEAARHGGRLEGLERHRLLAIIEHFNQSLKKVLTRREGRMFAETLMELAHDIAGASRNRFGMGLRVDAAELAMISRIRRLLALE